MQRGRDTQGEQPGAAEDALEAMLASRRERDSARCLKECRDIKEAERIILQCMNAADKPSMHFIPVEEFHRDAKVLADIVRHMSDAMVKSFLACDGHCRAHSRVRCTIPVQISYREHVLKTGGADSLLNILFW
jgi:hypothetical protein